MKIIKEHRLIIIFFFVVNCIVLLAVNYLIGNDVASPYGLSEDYKELHVMKNVQENKNDFDFLKKEKNVTVIAKTKDLALIGVYDPTMKYYLHSTKIIYPKLFRYFSMDDYKNERNVGIVVDSINRPGEKSLSDKDIANIEEKYHMKVIHRFDRQSLIVEGDVRVIQNFFSIPNSQITAIYMDSSNKKQLKEVLQNFQKIGYKEIKKENEKSIFETIKHSFYGKKYVVFILYSLGIIYFLLLYVFFVYLAKFENYLMINRMLGGTFLMMLVRMLLPIIAIMALVCMSSGFLIIEYLNEIHNNCMTMIQFLKVQIYLIISCLAIYFVKYMHAYQKSKRGMR